MSIVEHYWMPATGGGNRIQTAASSPPCLRHLEHCQPNLSPHRLRLVVQNRSLRSERLVWSPLRSDGSPFFLGFTLIDYIPTRPLRGASTLKVVASFEEREWSLTCICTLKFRRFQRSVGIYVQAARLIIYLKIIQSFRHFIVEQQLSPKLCNSCFQQSLPPKCIREGGSARHYTSLIVNLRPNFPYDNILVKPALIDNGPCALLLLFGSACAC